jgi:hypothetical protein
MSYSAVFMPTGTTTSISATTTSARAAFGSFGDPRSRVIRVHNAGSATVFYTTGDVSVAATTSNMPIPSGAVETLRVPPSHTNWAVITASGTATVYASTGEGL